MQKTYLIFSLTAHLQYIQESFLFEFEAYVETGDVCIFTIIFLCTGPWKVSSIIS
jgi:hypothetical protein